MGGQISDVGVSRLGSGQGKCDMSERDVFCSIDYDLIPIFEDSSEHSHQLYKPLNKVEGRSSCLRVQEMAQAQLEAGESAIEVGNRFRNQ